MNILGQIASWHVLLWAVPLAMAMVCSALGGRMSRRGAEILAAAGLLWPFLQAVASAVFFLWFGVREETALVVLPFSGAQGDFAWNFALDRVGSWAGCLSGALGLLTLVQAALVTRGWIGRHRYFALLLLVVASVNLLATARSLLALLLGWEGSLTAAAFMLGFWEAEEAERRTGMRWLLYQHLSAVCLLVGWLLLPEHSQSALIFLLACLILRLGLVPGHGWVVEQSHAPSSAQALVQTLASLLAAALLMERFAGLLLSSAWAVELMQGLGLASALVGSLAAVQQHRLAARLSWLVLVSAGLLTLSFFLQDLAAARLLVTAHGLTWCAAILALGVVEIFENDHLRQPVQQGGGRALWLIAALALVLPPGLSALALGRLLQAVTGF
jgi:formate hydrogenlyase subunit 3/multisubunit Na+/H+ antiporter MnhD subunit